MLGKHSTTELSSPAQTSLSFGDTVSKLTLNLSSACLGLSSSYDYRLGPLGPAALGFFEAGSYSVAWVGLELIM